MTSIETDGGFIRLSGTEADVARMLARRQALGIGKYHITVRDNPLTLRQWLVHQQEELADALIYATRALEELDRAEGAQQPYKPLMDPRVGTRIHGECWGAFDPQEDGK